MHVKKLIKYLKTRFYIKKLDTELYKIRCRNWILNEENGYGANGLKLESLLKKKKDRYILPDYNSIEIKAKSNNKYGIHLFSCAFDNKPCEIERFLSIVGEEKKNINIQKSFQKMINTKKGRLINNKYIKIYPDDKNKKVRLIIFIGSPRRYLTEMSWSYNELKSRLETKLEYFVLVHTSNKKINDNWYVKYDNWEFYKLKSFNDFINCIKEGYINIHFKIKKYNNRIYDKGTSFEIPVNFLDKLFNKIKR